jgi:drug/metabolite transporter (DMT)-like permease
MSELLTPSRSRALPFVMAAAVVGISVSGPLVRLSDAAPLAIAVWRLAIALGVIGAALVLGGSWREWRTLSRRDLVTALAAGALLAIHFWSWIASLDRTSVAASVLLVNLHPVVIVAGSALWLHERPRRAQIGGIAVALVGAAVIALGASGGEGSAASRLDGNLLAILGALTVGLYYLAGRALRQRLSLWPYVGLVYGACLIVLLAFAALQGTPLAPQPPREWLLFGGIAIGPMLLGHTGFNWSLRYVPAFVVSLALLLEPVGATVIAMLLPGIREVPSIWTIVGGGVLLAGLGFAALREE